MSSPLILLSFSAIDSTGDIELDGYRLISSRCPLKMKQQKELSLTERHCQQKLGRRDRKNKYKVGFFSLCIARNNKTDVCKHCFNFCLIFDNTEIYME